MNKKEISKLLKAQYEGNKRLVEENNDLKEENNYLKKGWNKRLIEATIEWRRRVDVAEANCKMEQERRLVMEKEAELAKVVIEFWRTNYLAVVEKVTRQNNI